MIVTTDKVYKIKNSRTFYKESDELGGLDPYSASKACAEITTLSLTNSYKKKSHQRISTARSGNVLGGGDYSKDRILPDILSALNNNKILFLRNPESVRPWQYVIEPLYGYMVLAKKQYENKLKKDNNSWNFGPNKKNFIKVNQIVKKINTIQRFKGIKIIKNKIKETDILKLDSNKSKKYLNWNSSWDIEKTLLKVLEWNKLYKKNRNARKICENQISEYIKDNLII